MKCSRCKATAQVALPSHHGGFCPDCFQLYFARQVEQAIHKHRMFTKDDKVLVALSGGKDSLALFMELVRQGYDVTGLHLDLGIPGSSGPARAKVEGFCERVGGVLKVVELAREGLPIPLVRDKVRRPICSMCGKIKRYFFNKVALDEGYSVLCTGHNLDDEVGRLFANTLRWDVSYLSDQGPFLPAAGGFASKCRPLFRLTEFETAAYCFFNGIDHHVSACPYSKGASFTVRKELMNLLERDSPGSKRAFYELFLKQGRPAFAAVEKKEGRSLEPCQRCGYPTSAETCGVCRVRDMLE